MGSNTYIIRKFRSYETLVPHSTNFVFFLSLNEEPSSLLASHHLLTKHWCLLTKCLCSAFSFSFLVLPSRSAFSLVWFCALSSRSSLLWLLKVTSSTVPSFGLIVFRTLCRFKPATVVVTSELPLGSGLGSSAAFCVALASTLLAYTDSVSLDLSHQGWLSFTEKDLEFVNKWGFEGEKIIHGKPSGIGNTVSAYELALPRRKVQAGNREKERKTAKEERGAEKEKILIMELLHKELEKEMARIPKANPCPFFDPTKTMIVRKLINWLNIQIYIKVQINWLSTIPRLTYLDNIFGSTNVW
ncbi:uncharacterized protein LOC128194215 [Vigna angularis]|uniref:uncharacterized protein LOC128194215 n=1 Tax=Phaseolus angularis TaxID=3914 RepID=UPI0022B4B7B0|nr:uncharacterized protein LOC128194215 [Vigna angularis]